MDVEAVMATPVKGSAGANGGGGDDLAVVLATPGSAGPPSGRWAGASGSGGGGSGGGAGVFACEALGGASTPEVLARRREILEEEAAAEQQRQAQAQGRNPRCKGSLFARPAAAAGGPTAAGAGRSAPPASVPLGGNPMRRRPQQLFAPLGRAAAAPSASALAADAGAKPRRQGPGAVPFARTALRETQPPQPVPNWRQQLQRMQQQEQQQEQQQQQQQSLTAAGLEAVSSGDILFACMAVDESMLLHSLHASFLLHDGAAYTMCRC